MASLLCTSMQLKILIAGQTIIFMNTKNARYNMDYREVVTETSYNIKRLNQHSNIWHVNCHSRPNVPPWLRLMAKTAMKLFSSRFVAVTGIVTVSEHVLALSMEQLQSWTKLMEGRVAQPPAGTQSAPVAKLKKWSGFNLDTNFIVVVCSDNIWSLPSIITGLSARSLIARVNPVSANIDKTFQKLFFSICHVACHNFSSLFAQFLSCNVSRWQWCTLSP